MTTAPAPAGSPASFEEFFHAEYDRLRRMTAMMLAGDVHQADDLVADVFVVLLKRWEHVENPHTWMKAVISRRVIKAGKTHRRNQTRLRQLWAMDRHGIADPVLLAERREDTARVLRQLTVLPPRQRVIAVLWWLHDWSQQDIAEHLQIRCSTVGTQIRRAENTMRRVFGVRGETLNIFDLDSVDEGEAL
ncbi:MULTISPECIES: sigma-70 family RNA polymerase sigma factor [unclassified Streptomyces]|uniref:RNA polymerase sigma factor n=1 Tax=unclassified Streptomyces TaxID=2593676 RepID=UPI00036506EB|nr:sigma-70 family RNA polymerase sigma factor [Streptomyces sp. BoleA5]MYX32718.1 sigma-70 family RNA polymerase sigma factor [Streptomyces sp. SID8377]